MLEELMVQWLRLGGGQITNEKIQEKVDEVFKGQMGKINCLHSSNSFNSILVTRSSITLKS